jgi:hypothetical protein
MQGRVAIPSGPRAADIRRLAWRVGCAVATLPFLVAVQQPTRALIASTSPADGTPLNLVILADESGSESSADVMHEAEAASAIAQSLLNPDSRVAVVGFGGPDQQAPYANPTSVACPPTITSATSNLEFLARCVSTLRPRTAAQGYNTDYVGALGQALSILSSGGTPGAINAILMMTDGGLDESYNPAYPQPDWQAAAQHAVDLKLAQARQAGVEVWPLGFGSIDPAGQAYLQHLAQGGGQIACDSRPASKPRAIIVQDSFAALSAFDSLYSAAACIGMNSSPSLFLPPGQSRVLTVNIPPIASDAAISVYKASPGIRVDFLTPDAVPVSGGSLNGSGFDLSGADTTVEVLHITNPQEGNWQVRLTAPPGLGSQLVNATVFWQGQVRASLIASPTNARPGQQITVTLTVLGRNGPITDPRQLSGIDVQVSVSGDGLSGPTLVPVTQEGGPGDVAGDYSGTFAAPSTPGMLTFTGSAAGYGLYGTEIPALVTVASTATILQATVQFMTPDTVLPGSVIHGQVLFNNQTGQNQTVRMVLEAGSALATVTSPGGGLVVPSGQSAVPFAIDLGPQTPAGPAQLTVTVVDARQPKIRYGNGQLLMTVQYPPSFVAKYRGELTAAGVVLLLILVAFCLRRLDRRRQRDVRGLVAALRCDDGSPGPELKAPGKRADRFRFVIRQPEGVQPLLDYPGTGDPVYVARRDGRGRVVVRTPDGSSCEIEPGGPGERIAAGVQLTFYDSQGGGSRATATGPHYGQAQVPSPPSDSSGWYDLS